MMHDSAAAGAASLKERLLARPRLAAAVERAVGDAEKQARNLGHGEGLVAEGSRLRALQLFEYAIATPPGTRHGRHDYWQAATAVRERGNETFAGILEWFGMLVDNGGSLGWSEDHLFDADVEPHHRRWNARHQQWAGFGGIDVARLSAGAVREHGRPRRGADGGLYTPATCEGLPGGPRSGVVVRFSEARAEVVVFGSRGDAAGWLTRRILGGHGPLPTTSDGPACRAVREEEILACLLRDPGDGQVRALVTEATFTSHLRAELFRVLAPGRGGRCPDREQARFNFEWNMLRAPGWALPLLGWPHPYRALRYLDRLTATPVTSAQASAAAQALAAADSTLAPALATGGPCRVPVQARRPLDPPPQRPHLGPAASRSPVMTVPPLPPAGAAGPVPCR